MPMDTQSRKAAPKVRRRKPGLSGRTRAEAKTAGRALRNTVPRALHGEWQTATARRDPIELLEQSNRGRLPELVPIRYGRMLRSPFAFLRGAAAVMAYDLAKTPTTGLRAQLCGDCHLLNFGLYATPERQLVFDLNDFDETHPGPWEWDLKRLAASFVMAARENHLSDATARDVVIQCVMQYRDGMRESARLTPMEVWYHRLEWKTVIELAPSAEQRRARQRADAQARRHVAEQLFPKIAKAETSGYRLVDQPPLMTHVANEPNWDERVRQSLSAYRLTLPDDLRVLLDRYHLEDVAAKVVGIGSVGTRCYIVLFMSADHDPLILQVKQAMRSVLEPYTGRSPYDNQGQRVVMGQRLMQSASDIFLGWARGLHGRDVYVRQLRDMKMSASLEDLSATQAVGYARICGWALACAHARSADAAAITGYLGRGDRFGRALVKFAAAYADQTERDHAALVRAVRVGRIQAVSEDSV